MNIVVLDDELSGIDVGPWYVVQTLILNINDSTAIETHEVVMLVDFGVKARGGAGVANLGHEPERHEGPQDSVDGHARDLRHVRSDRPVNLLGGRMVLALQDRFKDGPPLDGDWQAALAVGRHKPVSALLFVCRAHLSDDEYMYQMIHICK
jgi:hypothetical protein